MKKILHKWDLWILAAFICIAILSPFLAGNRPIFCVSSKGITFPVSDDATNHRWQQNPLCQHGCKWIPLISFSPGDIDRSNKGAGPSFPVSGNSWRSHHWLGTDDLGRDVASGLIHGTSVAMITGVLAVFLSFIIGICAGMFGAYSRHLKPEIGILQLLLVIFGGLLIWFYGLGSWSYSGDSALWKISSLAILALWIYICFQIPANSGKWKSMSLPLDELLVKVLEIRKSLPGLLIIMALSTIIPSQSLWILAGVIALLGWTDFARLARAETLAAMGENYVKSLQMLGIPSRVILFRHILPNSLPTLGAAACFSIAGAVLLESSLSFLGMGLPAEKASWGKMLAEGRNMQQWWLVVFPGFALFLLVLALNKTADRISANRKGREL